MKVCNPISPMFAAVPATVLMICKFPLSGLWKPPSPLGLLLVLVVVLFIITVFDWMFHCLSAFLCIIACFCMDLYFKFDSCLKKFGWGYSATSYFKSTFLCFDLSILFDTCMSFEENLSSLNIFLFINETVSSMMLEHFSLKVEHTPTWCIQHFFVTQFKTSASRLLWFDFWNLKVLPSCLVSGPEAFTIDRIE